MKILAGVYATDFGTIQLDGRVIQLHSVKDAEHLGIVLIHQELNLAGHLDIAGNVFLGREPSWGGPLGFIDQRRLHEDAARIVRRLGLVVSTHTPVRDLSIGQQQLVEIARACRSNRGS